jgi:hypothetical protein
MGLIARISIAFICVLAAFGGAWGAELRPESPDAAQRPWPFNAVRKPVVPAGAKHPIDAFLSDGKTIAKADRRTLLRRVTFDLTGLPPTIDEQDAFVNDSRPDAYERVVDRLLASPHYGERMAQYWLDLVRFAESDGFQEDRLREGAYLYRDYVIRAFNADMSYDQFLRQQLAGDELEPDNIDARVATSFYRLGGEETNAVALRQRRQEIIDDVVHVVGQAMLGLTVGCAQCHDHKYDDIPQSDYYRLAAFFQPMVQTECVVASDEERADFAQRQQAWEEATSDIRQRLAEITSAGRERQLHEARVLLGGEVCRAIDTPDRDRTPLERQLATQAAVFLEWKTREVKIIPSGKAAQVFDEQLAKLSTFDHLKPDPLPTVETIADAGNVSPPTFRLAMGMVAKPLEELQPGYPQLLGGGDARIESLDTGAPTTGRRAALARWLTDYEHPLTARVIANRLWQQHFGVGIVATTSDFGVMGAPPTNRELLDWLAADLMEHGWSLKRLHRRIVTSEHYQRETSRTTRRALEGEAIRDAMLAVSGDLNRRMFGRSERPDLPPNVGSDTWTPDTDPAQRDRRSIYLLVKRNLRYPMFEAFDAPGRQESCPRRDTTVTASQALVLLNSPFSHEQADRWAERLLQLYGDSSEHDLVRRAYLEAYGRAPSENEIEAAEQFLAKRQAMAGGGEKGRRAAVAGFCHAIFSSNEFLYVD